MTTARSTLLLALRIDRRLIARHQAYEEACLGDIAQGYRPQYCEHGVYQWTDYDAVCGGCEMGETMGDPMQRRRVALDEAHWREARASRVALLLREASDLGLGDALDYASVVAEYERLLLVGVAA